MSVQTVMEFWQAAQEDPALQDRIRSAIQGRDGDEALSAVVDVAAASGYTFTPSDYEKAREQIPKLLTSADDDTSAFGLTVGAAIGGRLIGAGGALRPGGVLRRGGVLNGGGLGTGGLSGASAGFQNFR